MSEVACGELVRTYSIAVRVRVRARAGTGNGYYIPFFPLILK